MSESIESIKEILEANGFIASGKEPSPHRKGYVLHMFEHGSIEGTSAIISEALSSKGKVQKFRVKGKVSYSEEMHQALNQLRGNGWVGGYFPSALLPVYEMDLSCHPGAGLDFCRRFTSAMVEQLAKGVKE